MTREYTHDDVCRGAADGCDCDRGWCEGCERNVPLNELEDGRCEECRAEFEEEGAA